MSINNWRIDEDSTKTISGNNWRIDGDYVKCPNCGEVPHIGGLIGPHTNDCPRCGSPVLTEKTS